VNVEAMASGVPVVATCAGGMREVIEHERTGLLVSLSRLEEELPDRICTLLQNPDYAKRLGEQGRNRVLDHFTWSHTAERLSELYHKLQKL
jgi:spore coat protein SA